MKFYKTINKNLENFLFMHKISFEHQGRTEDGCTYWVYVRTPRFEAVLQEYKEIYPERFRRA